MLLVCPSFKLMFSRWNKHSKLAIGRGTKFLTSHLSTRRGRRNSKISTCMLGIGIGCLRMKDLRLPYLLMLTSSLFPSACFFVWDGNHKLHKFGCLILTICMMMSLPSTFLLIPLSLTLLLFLTSN